tara:strand:- start:19 stop:354 length:336 start_codon:yes stop_codon:yes gene_type:complete
MEITYENFRKVQIRVGTVLSLKINKKARQPALVLEVNFGNAVGIKTTSAKITHYYNQDNLIGKQIIAVCNFPAKNIAGIVSEVLILGAIETDGKVVLLHPSQKVENGLEIY